MAGETSNPGYQDSQTYANAPSGNAPDQTHQEYGRGINSYALEQAGEAALLASVFTVNSGDVFINKTSSDISAVGLELLASGAFIATRDNSVCLVANRNTGDGELVQFRKDNGVVGDITTTAGATAYNTSSDYRLKENVVDLTGATDRLKQIPVRRFNFIGQDQTVDGFLAHEVQDVVPEAVTGAKDATDENGDPKYQGIDQSKLVPLLVATIKELEARIATLENA